MIVGGLLGRNGCAEFLEDTEGGYCLGKVRPFHHCGLTYEVNLDAA